MHWLMFSLSLSSAIFCFYRGVSSEGYAAGETGNVSKCLKRFMRISAGMHVALRENREPRRYSSAHIILCLNSEKKKTNVHLCGKLPAVALLSYKGATRPLSV